MKDSIIDLGKLIYSRGWSPATGGNFSARLSDSDSTIAMSASGRHKGELTAADILTVDLQGRSLDPNHTPSAETLLHLAVYRLDETAQMVLHTHSVAATVLSRQSHDAIQFDGYEMLKAIRGVTTHETQARLSIFDNAQDMTMLDKALQQDWQNTKNNFGFLVRGHGLYVWGKSADEARRHLEAWEFLLACELAARQIK